jgi:hypothetical protein
MKKLTWFEKLVDWLFTPKYNCQKGKHRNGYILSESGLVYLDEREVPKNLWHCLDCGKRKYNK